MNKRQFLVVCACLFLLGELLTYCQKFDDKLVFNVKVKEGYSPNNCDSNFYFLTEITIKNSSNSKFDFLAYSCLTSCNFLTSNKNVQICQNSCSSNGIYTISLQPDQSFTLPVILRTRNGSSVINSYIQLGIVLIRPSEFKGIDLYKEIDKRKLDKEKILWSHAFVLGFSGIKPFEVK